MRNRFKRATAGLAAFAVAAVVAPLVAPWSALAAPAGTPPNGVVFLNESLDGAPLTGGNSDTDIYIDLEDPQVCPGDGATDNYRYQSYLVDAANDPATLTYDASVRSRAASPDSPRRCSAPTATPW